MLYDHISFVGHIVLLFGYIIGLVVLSWILTYGICFKFTEGKELEDLLGPVDDEHNFLKLIAVLYFVLLIFCGVIFGTGFSYVSVPDKGGMAIHTSFQWHGPGAYQSTDFIGGTFSAFGVTTSEYHRTDIDGNRLFWRIKPEKTEEFFAAAKDSNIYKKGRGISAKALWHARMKEAAIECKNESTCILDHLRNTSFADFAEIMHVERHPQEKK